VIIPGLSACAAAVDKNGLAWQGAPGVSPLILRKRGECFRTLEELHAAAPLAETPEIVPWIEDFEPTMRRLAEEELSRPARSSDPPAILVVSHREGMRDLSALAAGPRIRETPYCCLAAFLYDRRGGGAWTCVGCQALDTGRCLHE